MMSISSQCLILISRVLALALLLSCGGELPSPPESEETKPEEPEGRRCPLPKENPVIVDISGEDIGFLFALSSDGTPWFWGSGYPTQRYVRGDEKDEPCLTAIDANIDRAGLSYFNEIVLLDYNQLAFTFNDVPHFMKLPGGAKPIAIQADRDYIALDDQGGVWALLQRLPYGDVPATGDFARVELPAPAAAIEADVGYCVRLVNGEVWCVDRLPDEDSRFGLGIGVELPTLTKLPIEGAKDFFLGFANSCWLDQAGALRCAGKSFPDPTFTEWIQPTYQLVPDVPPFKNLWLRQQGGGCALAEDDDLWCWGLDTFDLAPPDKAVPPTPVGNFPGLKDVAMTYGTTCVLRADNEVVCQGSTAVDNSCDVPDANGWYTIVFGGCGGEGL
jgi:hypothetical protein